MTRDEKAVVLEDLKQKFAESSFFYVADTTTMTVDKVNKLRRSFFENNIQMVVVKNKIALKALEAADPGKNFSAIYPAFKGTSAVLFTQTANLPARLIETFRKENEYPLVKAAYIDTAVYFGDENLSTLSKLKSKEELVGEVLGLLQSPARNVISALQSGGQTIAGLVKTLQERSA
jgi:large subunit ribosomal protein L10